MEWVKLYHGFIRDEKMHFITKRYGHDAGLLWPVLLSEVDDAGVLQMDMEIFSEIIMVESQRLDEIISIYLRYGLVTKCNASSGHETIKVAHWEKYQYCESYLRVKRFRERQKGMDVTLSNADETEVKRTRNASVTTEREREEDKDLDQRESSELDLLERRASQPYPSPCTTPPPPSLSLSQKTSIDKKGKIPEEGIEWAIRERPDLTREHITQVMARKFEIHYQGKPISPDELFKKWMEWIVSENRNGTNGQPLICTRPKSVDVDKQLPQAERDRRQRHYEQTGEFIGHWQ
jgi:hypothetical protein